MSLKSFMNGFRLFFVLIYLNFFAFSLAQKGSKNIFDETYLKNLKIKNRFFRSAVGDNSFVGGKITEEGFKLYDQLSKNDVMNIFTGLTIVSDYYQIDNFYPFRLDNDEYIPEFKKLVDVVHKNGEKLFYAISSYRNECNDKT